MIAVRYFALVGFVYFWVYKKNATRFAPRKIQTKTASPQIIKREIQWSLLSSIIFGAAGALGFLAWEAGLTRVELDLNTYLEQWGWLGMVLSYLGLLFLHDTYFYWMHRLVHHPRLFARVHRVHHDSMVPTPWAAFSFHPYEAVLEAAILPALLLFIPLHISVLVAFLLTMTVLGIINHLGYEFYFKGFDDHPIAKWLISASHHDQHHQKFRGNYGLYFTFWDRMCGTQF